MLCFVYPKISVTLTVFGIKVHVFQTFPFLEAATKAFSSCRDFVRNILPHLYPLNKDVKEDLEREIDNAETQGVMGDGLEMGVLSDESVEGPLNDLGDDDSNDSGSRERGGDFEQTSWIRQSPSVSLTSDDEPGQDVESLIISISTGSPTTSVESPPQPSTSKFKLSLLSPLSAEFPDQSASQSRSSNDLDTRVPPSANAPHPPRNHQRRATGGLNRIHRVAMSPSVTTAPTPTVRSQHRAISHPDISSLCREWADKGPANRTTRYVMDAEDREKS